MYNSISRELFVRLDEYLFRIKVNKTEFAKQIGISRTHLTLISSGKRKPSPTLAKKIIEATKGLVTLSELLFPEDHPAKLIT